MMTEPASGIKREVLQLIDLQSRRWNKSRL